MSEIQHAGEPRKGESSADRTGQDGWLGRGRGGFVWSGGASPRIVYFGSRSWIDVQPGATIEEAKRDLRTGHVYKGPRYRAVRDAMRVDLVRFGGAICVVEGEADGADLLARKVAEELCQEVLPFPVDHRLDGPWPGAGPRRNARMFREGQPIEGRCFASGRAGEPISRGTLSMLSVLGRGAVPVVVWREDGAVLA